jgi:DNA helicase-2/ATP-dependent DNA helicase PcrA
MEHHTVVYGKAMHEAVSVYLRARLLNQHMDVSDLIKVFEGSFKPEGFLSQAHQNQRLKVGREALWRFYYEEEKSGRRPSYVEKDFSFVFQGNKVMGRFDRIDIESTGAVIIDYKTSEIKSQQEADKRARGSLQLFIYSLAYKHIYNQLPAAAKLHFLESGFTGSIQIKEKNLKTAQQKILKASEGIRRRDFRPRPAYLACAYCAYNRICVSSNPMPHK